MGPLALSEQDLRTIIVLVQREAASKAALADMVPEGTWVADLRDDLGAAADYYQDLGVRLMQAATASEDPAPEESEPIPAEG